MRRLILLAVLCLLSMSAFGQSASRKPATEPIAKVPGAAETHAASASLPSKQTIESFLKAMFSYDPNISYNVLQIKPTAVPQVSEVDVQLKTPEGVQPMKFYVLPDQKWAIAGDMIPFGADPFAPVREELAARAHGPSRGPANAPVTIVEFSDLECPACKAAQPTIERLLTDVPDVHFIFQNFPLEQLHPWAFKAAEYADCVSKNKPDAFWKFIELDYTNQEQVTTENVDQKMKEFAAQAGASPEAVTACVAEPATAARVRESIALGEAVHLTGTPTLYVNGRRIQNVLGVPYDMLKQLVSGTPK